MDADLTTHRIEGYVHTGEALSVGLISEIMPNLYMGGCRDGVCLPSSFDYVLSLYPWEKYVLTPGTERLEVTMYDAGEVPDEDQLYQLASQVNNWRYEGKTLVHCQAGLNRSGLVTALALVLDGYTPDLAINLLREKRDPLVLCNAAFVKWLRGLVSDGRGWAA